MFAIVARSSRQTKSLGSKYHLRFSLRSLLALMTVAAIISGLAHILSRQLFDDATPLMAVLMMMCLGVIAGQLIIGLNIRRIRDLSARLNTIEKSDIIAFAIGYAIAFAIVPIILNLLK